LSTTFTTASAVVDPTGSITLSPSATAIAQSASFHVFAFTPKGGLLVSESKGSFDTEKWNEVYTAAERSCCSEDDLAQRGSMIVESQESESNVYSALKKAIVEKVEAEQKWRQIS
jgi:exosome complex component RRP46